MISILAIDTSTDSCSVALMYNTNNIVDDFNITNKKHEKNILPMINSLLIKSNISLNEINAIAYSRGPGDFTSIRVGLSVAQGLSIGANIPLIDVSTLSVLAEHSWRKNKSFNVLTAVDARMNEVYWAIYIRYSQGLWITKNEKIISINKLSILLNNLTGYWTTAGNGWVRYPELKYNKNITVSYNIPYSDARDIIPLALYKYKNKKFTKYPKLNYLRTENFWKKI
ncbi:MAG: tRNA (adenosine(37)-N6)-threonylcarbamoyltransferase complex dimerization subunit type 1 TsaB [Enterobacterales bacterium]